MALSPKVAVLLLPGLLAVVLWPHGSTVLWWWLAVLAGIGVDLALAASPAALRITREPLVGLGTAATTDDAARASSPRPLQPTMATTSLRLGASARTGLLVHHTGTRRARGWLRDAWVPSAGAAQDRHHLDVPAGERRRYSTVLTPTRRGDRTADRVTVRLFGPLGVAARQSSRVVDGSVRVLHPFGALRHLPSRLDQLRQLDGRAAVRVRGQGTEFDSLRDWVDGDDVRSIDWRATARRRDLVVRTWQPEQHRRIVIVLDTSRTSAGRIGDAPRLDAAMDAALLLTTLAGHARDHVEIVAGDRQVQAALRLAGPAGGADAGSAGSGTAHLLRALAPVQPRLVEADWDHLAAQVMHRGNRRSLLVLLTALESAAVEATLLPVLPAVTARHHVVVASVADPVVDSMRRHRDTSEEVYHAVAAERTLGLRRRTRQALERLGVDVVDAVPDELPPRLADHYLSLKAHGLL